MDEATIHGPKQEGNAIKGLIAIVLLLGVVPAACTGNERAGEADPCLEAEDVHACRWDQIELGPDHPRRLLRMAEIADVVRRSPSESQPGSVPSRGLCFGAYLGDLNYSFLDGARAIMRYEAAKRGAEISVDDLGSEAYWDPDRRALHVATDGGYFFITVPDLAGPRRIAIRLARIAVGRTAERNGG